MEYQDFPILNNLDYQLINTNYNTNKENKKNIISNICNKINTILLSLFHLNNLYNSTINNEINNHKKLLTKTQNNLSNLFNIQTQPTETINSFSIFDFLKELNILSASFLEWLKVEEKEYYRSVAIKTLHELITNQNQLIESLNNSYVKFYKYM